PRGDFGDRPRRDFADRGDRPNRPYGERGDRGDRGDRPPRPEGDRPRSFGDRPPRGDFGDRPRRDFADRGERPNRPYGERSDRPQRPYDDRPRRDFAERGGDRPSRQGEDRPRGFGDRPARGEYVDRPRREFSDRGDRPNRPYGDRPPRPEGDRLRSFGDRPPRGDFADRPQRDFASRGDRPQRDFAERPRWDNRDNRGGRDSQDGRGERGQGERFERGPRHEFRDAPERAPRQDFRDDHAEARAPLESPERVFDDEGLVRVSKLMAERGICSRREADGYIERGWVFVNGERVAELGTRAAPDAEITLSKEAQRNQDQQVTVLLNKPVGYVSGQAEDGYEPAIVLIRPENRWSESGGPAYSPAHLRGMAPAGRLDIDSVGLLVLTQDGRVARRIIGADSEVDKEYLVRVEGQLIDNGLALLNHGLELDGDPLEPAQVEWINDDQLRFVLREGKKRQIRRMCELVGLKVVGLKRVRIGGVKLGNLPPGQWRYLEEGEAF
ncbi:pseudouridine synthase, partial [Oryzomicrobium sp.]|uniref:pseudouridine synthase n=1 Tax=Oryzomicrobium sp. TaxID=1911578 RepID=UPI0025F4583F